jgi:hypothetical protein
MKTTVIMLSIFIALAAAPAMAGNCDYSWQVAADGSSCGDRAADVRPGGR